MRVKTKANTARIFFYEIWPTTRQPTPVLDIRSQGHRVGWDAEAIAPPKKIKQNIDKDYKKFQVKKL